MERLTPSPADVERMIEYLDGALDAPAMVAFERRLEAEPELARALEEFADVDRLQRASARRLSPEAIESEHAGAERARGRRFAWLLTCAAAAGLVATAAAWFLANRASPAAPLRFELAALGTREASAEDVNRALGLAEGWLPARMRDGGPPAQELPSESEYLERALEAQTERASAALEAGTAGTSPIRAGRFALVLRPERDAWAVVVALPDTGAPVRLFPLDAADPGARLRAGTLAFLPRPWVAAADGAGEPPRADLDFGFLVPRRAGELRVLTGLLAEAPSPELLAELDRQLTAVAGSSDERGRILADWLEARGFAVGEVRVLEPE